MDDQRIQFLERARVEQRVDPLARGQLAGRVLLFDAFDTPALPGSGVRGADRLEAGVGQARNLTVRLEGSG